MKQKTPVFILGIVGLALGIAGAAEKPKDGASAKSEAAGPASSGSATAKDGKDAKPASAPRITVEPESFDFGKALQQKTLTKEFSIRNFGNAELVIDNISTTCGCTAAVPAEKNIKPGGSTPLHVELQTRSNTGKIERIVMIRTNDPVKPVYEVKVAADVVPGEQPQQEPPAQ